MLLDDIYVMWIPIVVIALMAALGYWRGVYRELIVSASIVLSALVAVQWATQERWAADLSNTFSGLGPGEWQFFLTLVLVGLIVAVVGYGLGGLFARRALSSTSRTLGALLGLANGAALSGWVLRAAYEGLVNRQDTSAVYQNPVSLSLMVWAGWFPVALAVIGAIAALVYSLTGEKTIVAIDVRDTGVHAVQPATRDAYMPPLQPVYQPIVIPPAQARVDHYMPRPPDVHIDPYLPGRDQAAMASTVANPITSVPNFSNVSAAPAMENREALPIRSVSSNSAPVTPPSGIAVPPSIQPTPAIDAPQSSVAPHTPPFGYDLAALWGQGDDDTATSGPTASMSGAGSEPQMPISRVVIAPSSNERRCGICGNIVQPGAAFCTECGTRVTQ